MNPFFDFFQRNHILAKIELAHCSKSTNLSLEDCDLTALPESVLSCSELQTLLLTRNKLKILPVTLHSLRNLQMLALDYNNLDTFPVALRQLHHLKVLNISHNPLFDLTDISSLVSLEVLWCNNCCLSSLPESIGLLDNLDTLGARNNQIELLPDGLCKLNKLR